MFLAGTFYVEQYFGTGAAIFFPLWMYCLLAIVVQLMVLLSLLNILRDERIGVRCWILSFGGSNA